MYKKQNSTIKYHGFLVFCICCSHLSPAQLTKGAITTSTDSSAQKLKDLTAPINTANRIALVIGNENYTSGKLKNPVNDAMAIAKVLRQHGFRVIYKTDIAEAEIGSVIDEFGKAVLKNDGVNLFYYSGHGIQFNEENYFLPVNTDLEKAESLSTIHSKLKTIMHKMDQAAAGLNIIILDACRSNPFENLAIEMKKGLSDIDDCPINTTVFYATKPNKVALDGERNHSPFTEALLKNMDSDTLEFYEIARRVTRDVLLATNQQQCPIVLGTALKEFYFKQKKQPRKPDLYIISVGISKYDGVHDLTYGSKSANDFTQLIRHVSTNDTTYGATRIFEVANKEATKFNILNIVNQVRKQVQEGDVVLFYYNGFIAKSLPGERYCIPSDGNFQNIESTGILCSTLFSVLTEMPCKSVLFFDKVEESQPGDIAQDNFDYIREITSPGKNVVVITTASNNTDQYAMESRDFQSTIFIYSLQKAFEKTLKENGAVDLLNLTIDIKNRSTELTRGLMSLEVFLPRGWLNFTLFRN